SRRIVGRAVLLGVPHAVGGVEVAIAVLAPLAVGEGTRREQLELDRAVAGAVAVGGSGEGVPGVGTGRGARAPGVSAHTHLAERAEPFELFHATGADRRRSHLVGPDPGDRDLDEAEDAG